jgi:hypothetical protein
MLLFVIQLQDLPAKFAAVGYTIACFQFQNKNTSLSSGIAVVFRASGSVQQTTLLDVATVSLSVNLFRSMPVRLCF